MKFLPVFCLALLAACAAHPPKPGGGETAARTAANDVLIFRDGDEWKARFRFATDAPVWAFERSAMLRAEQRPWRPESWEVTTPGVSLERVGDFDAFVAADGDVPREVTIRFRPLAKDLVADYDPAIRLSDGTLALYGGHFKIFPKESREAAAALREPQDYPTRIALTAAGTPLLFGGQRVTRADDVGDNYVYVGEVAVSADDPVATILDPGLPAWISTRLRDFTPAVFRDFETRMGPHKSGRPMVIASWAGTDFAGVSTGGSVSPGMITMRLEGKQLLKETPGALNQMRWFIAHEAAHFWLGETVRYATPDEAWITEGGADYLAMQAAVRADASYDAKAFMADARSDCIAALARGSLADARRRNDQRAYYACGALFAKAVDDAGRSRGKGFADFVRGLIRDDADGQVTGAEWLSAARAFGISDARIGRIEAMIAGKVDAAPAIDALVAD
ncbi:hypothetical protein [Sphingopyxis sp. JAI128]|uniref:hypothetical protein n=1 Tax=Sphingopyxis sp. JAI128 TaxID=2723066 RepID=UPI001614AF5E|nr:hypothetical protein [Sphingopyxis sp. JAI128]MBB6428130.1 hypothetical protein [Sphingopyxis sp. JAI128]